VGKNGPSDHLIPILAMIALHSRISPKVLLAALGFCHAGLAAEIRFLPLTDEISERKIGLQDDKTLTPLSDLNARKRSKIYHSKPSKKPLLLVALDRERPNGKPTGVEFVLAPEMKSPLVLIFSDAEDPSGMRAVVVEDGTQGFPWGTLRFVNTTEKPFMIRYEKETKAITDGLTPFDVSLGGEARNIGIQVFSEDNPDAILYSAVWEHDPNLRKLIFIVPAADPAVKEVKLEIIPQDKRVKN
jgi:hypothetical protein